MITGPDVYRKAVRRLAELENREKDGTATPGERERCDVVRDHVLVYEWASDGNPAVDVVPRLVPFRSDNPTVRAFADWWERVGGSERWAQDGWRVGLLYWWQPRGLASLTEEIEVEVERDLHARGLADEADAVLTNLGEWERQAA